MASFYSKKSTPITLRAVGHPTGTTLSITLDHLRQGPADARRRVFYPPYLQLSLPTPLRREFRPSTLSVDQGFPIIQSNHLPPNFTNISKRPNPYAIKGRDGVVRLRGAIRIGTAITAPSGTNEGTAILKLPPAFRPAQTSGPFILSTVAGNGANATGNVSAYVHPDGFVRAASAMSSDVRVVLDPIQFFADCL